MRVSNKIYMKQLKLAALNDRMIQASRKGIQSTLPKQRQYDMPITDPTEIRAKAFNNLNSLFGPARAEAFLAGQTIEDMEKINISWKAIEPQLSKTTGLTNRFFDKMLTRL